MPLSRISTPAAALLCAGSVTSGCAAPTPTEARALGMRILVLCIVECPVIVTTAGGEGGVAATPEFEPIAATLHRRSPR